MALTFQRVTIFGAGPIGTGIAQVCALAGAQVTLCEPAPDTLRRAQKTIESELRKAVDNKTLSRAEEQATRARLKYESGLLDCSQSDLAIEAISERLDLKHELFSRLDSQLPPISVLATSTSTLSVTTIASKTRFPERVCGLHFLHPPARVPVVEVVAALGTSEDTIQRCASFVRELGKEPVRVQDSPGFVVSRCTRPFFAEALRCLGEGLTDVPTIDMILREGGGFAEGPFELMDRIGIDATYAATRAVWEGFQYDDRFRPHLILRKLVESGRLGRKSGRGFYEYPDAG